MASLEYLPKEQVESQASAWATYLAKKLTNKDEIRLMQNPAQELTPLFLAGLHDRAKTHQVALFFDTYEYTGEYLDAWLRGLFEGHYGEMPLNMIFGIAGRHELDKNAWVTYTSLLARLPLEPFQERETLDYLARKGIIEKSVIEVILKLSGNLPLLVATLAAETPRDTSQVGDPSGTAVDRFLMWEKNHLRREVALNASFPRILNQDIVAQLVDDDAEALFAWIKSLPFVEGRTYGWAYHQVVRKSMLHYKRRETPQEWATLHAHLAAHYEQLRDNLGLESGQSAYNATWQGFALEALYHRLCQAWHKYLPASLNGFLAAFYSSNTFARLWAETIQQAEEDSGLSTTECWGGKLVKVVKASSEHSPDETVAKILGELIEDSSVKETWHPLLLTWRGHIYSQRNFYLQALDDFSRAIKAMPNSPLYRMSRALLYIQMKHYDEALTDIDQFVQQTPDDAFLVRVRVLISIGLGRLDEAKSLANQYDEIMEKRKQSPLNLDDPKEQEQGSSRLAADMLAQGFMKAVQALLESLEAKDSSFETDLKMLEAARKELDEATRLNNEMKQKIIELQERYQAEIDRIKATTQSEELAAKQLEEVKRRLEEELKQINEAISPLIEKAIEKGKELQMKVRVGNNVQTKSTNDR